MTEALAVAIFVMWLLAWSIVLVRVSGVKGELCVALSPI